MLLICLSIWRPPGSKRTDTLFPDPPLYRSHRSGRRHTDGGAEDVSRGVAGKEIARSPSPFTLGCAERAPSLSRWEREGAAKPRKGEGDPSPTFLTLTMRLGSHHPSRYPEYVDGFRSEERSGGKECGRTVRAWGSRCAYNKKNKK